MLLYHGSDKIIEKPIFGYGKIYNDYGLGFYCTETEAMAMEWGVQKNKDGYANCYELACDNITILDLNSSEYNILQWLAILLENRTFDETSALAYEAKAYILENFLPAYESYDIIKGYRADDSYFSYAQDFLNGAISYRQLGNAMRLGRLGEQVVLKSQKAFNNITFKSFAVAVHQEWFSKKLSRDKEARREYFDLERNRRQKGDLYITDILDEEMKSDDSRLR